MRHTLARALFVAVTLAALLTFDPRLALAQKVVNTIILTSGLRGVAVNATTNRLYVANFELGTLTVLDGSTYQLVDTVSVGNGPTGVAVDAFTNRIYVTNTLDNTVVILNGGDDSILQTVSVGNRPIGVAVNTV